MIAERGLVVFAIGVVVFGGFCGGRCLADTFRIGRRAKGDQTILKKVLLSVPTTQRSNQTVIYEYSATKAVSCIEYLVENLTDEESVEADIAFTGEYSLAAKFHLYNIQEMVIVMSIYGFDSFNVPLHFQPILVPQFLLAQDNASPKFGLGFRQPQDELIFFATQSTAKTKAALNHSLAFDETVEHYITYVSFSVDSKTAGVTFIRMSEHQFSGIVYDFNCHILFANLYVYGFKKDKLPDDYEPMQPIDTNFDPNQTITLAGVYREWIEDDEASGGASRRCNLFGALIWMHLGLVIALKNRWEYGF